MHTDNPMQRDVPIQTDILIQTDIPMQTDIPTKINKLKTLLKKQNLTATDINFSKTKRNA